MPLLIVADRNGRKEWKGKGGFGELYSNEESFVSATLKAGRPRNKEQNKRRHPVAWSRKVSAGYFNLNNSGQLPTGIPLA